MKQTGVIEKGGDLWEPVSVKGHYKQDDDENYRNNYCIHML
jgi:hypothetical protein